jgi:hypothetical protein
MDSSNPPIDPVICSKILRKDQDMLNDSNYETYKKGCGITDTVPNSNPDEPVYTRSENPNQNNSVFNPNDPATRKQIELNQKQYGITNNSITYKVPVNPNLPLKHGGKRSSNKSKKSKKSKSKKSKSKKSKKSKRKTSRK